MENGRLADRQNVLNFLKLRKRIIELFTYSNDFDCNYRPHGCCYHDNDNFGPHPEFPGRETLVLLP